MNVFFSCFSCFVEKRKSRFFWHKMLVHLTQNLCAQNSPLFIRRNAFLNPKQQIHFLANLILISKFKAKLMCVNNGSDNFYVRSDEWLTFYWKLKHDSAVDSSNRREKIKRFGHSVHSLFYCELRYLFCWSFCYTIFISVLPFFSSSLSSNVKWRRFVFINSKNIYSVVST